MDELKALVADAVQLALKDGLVPVDGFFCVFPSANVTYVKVMDRTFKCVFSEVRRPVEDVEECG